MTQWHFVVADTSGNRQGELTAAKGKSVTWQLDAAATAQFTLNGRHPQALLITETESDLLVFQGNTLRFRGRLGTSGDDLSSDGHTCQFSAVDYRGFLDVRMLWPGSTTIFTAADQADIAWQLISDSETRDTGAAGYSRGSAASTGVARTITYQEGSVLSQIISQLGDLDNGFDWEIDPTLALNIFYPQRGTDAGQVLDWGGRVGRVQRATDTSKFATAIRYSGADGVTPVTVDIGTYGAAGRWERQIGDTTIGDSTTLMAAATAELARDAGVDPSYNLTLNPGWWTPDALWLGDTAQLVAKSGRLDVNTSQRVTQIQVTIGDDGGETDVLTTGPVFRDLPERFRLALQRISLLEHR